MRNSRSVCLLPELEGHKLSYCIDSWLPKDIAGLEVQICYSLM